MKHVETFFRSYKHYINITVSHYSHYSQRRLSDFSYSSHFKVIWKNLNLNRIDSVDVTLACEDGHIKAHKVLTKSLLVNINLDCEPNQIQAHKIRDCLKMKNKVQHFQKNRDQEEN